MSISDLPSQSSDKAESPVKTAQALARPLVDMTSSDTRSAFSADDRRENVVSGSGELHFPQIYGSDEHDWNTSRVVHSFGPRKRRDDGDTERDSKASLLSAAATILKADASLLTVEANQIASGSGQPDLFDLQAIGNSILQITNIATKLYGNSNVESCGQPSDSTSPPIVNDTSGSTIFAPVGNDSSNPVTTPVGNDSGGTTNPVSDTNNPPVTSTDGKFDGGTIHGINVSGPEWASGDNWPSMSQLEQYKADGLATIRLPISWQRFQNTPYGPLDPTELGKLSTVMQEAQSLGMGVMIDNHNYDRYGAPDQINWGKGPVVTDPNQLADFWGKMSSWVDKSAYSSSVIGYDLMNEPDTDGNNWWPNAQNAINAIRATGDTKALFVENDSLNGVSSWDNLKKLNDPDNNIVYEEHSYWDPNTSGDYSNAGEPANSQVAINDVAPFVNWLKANNAQGMVGEFQVPSDDTAWVNTESNFLNYLNQNNVGWTVWGGGAFGRSNGSEYNNYYIPGSQEETALKNAAESAEESGT